MSQRWIEQYKNLSLDPNYTDGTDVLADNKRNKGNFKADKKRNKLGRKNPNTEPVVNDAPIVAGAKNLFNKYFVDDGEDNGLGDILEFADSPYEITAHGKTVSGDRMDINDNTTEDNKKLWDSANSDKYAEYAVAQYKQKDGVDEDGNQKWKYGVDASKQGFYANNAAQIESGELVLLDEKRTDDALSIRNKLTGSKGYIEQSDEDGLSGGSVLDREPLFTPTYTGVENEAQTPISKEALLTAQDRERGTLPLDPMLSKQRIKEFHTNVYKDGTSVFNERYATPLDRQKEVMRISRKEYVDFRKQEIESPRTFMESLDNAVDGFQAAGIRVFGEFGMLVNGVGLDHEEEQKDNDYLYWQNMANKSSEIAGFDSFNVEYGAGQLDQGMSDLLNGHLIDGPLNIVAGMKRGAIEAIAQSSVDMTYEGLMSSLLVGGAKSMKSGKGGKIALTKLAIGSAMFLAYTAKNFNVSEGKRAENNKDKDGNYKKDDDILGKMMRFGVEGINVAYESAITHYLFSTKTTGLFKTQPLRTTMGAKALPISETLAKGTAKSKAVASEYLAVLIERHPKKFAALVGMGMLSAKIGERLTVGGMGEYVEEGMTETSRMLLETYGTLKYEDDTMAEVVMKNIKRIRLAAANGLMSGGPMNAVTKSFGPDGGLVGEVARPVQDILKRGKIYKTGVNPDFDGRSSGKIQEDINKQTNITTKIVNDEVVFGTKDGQQTSKDYLKNLDTKDKKLKDDALKLNSDIFKQAQINTEKETDKITGGKHKDNTIEKHKESLTEMGVNFTDEEIKDPEKTLEKINERIDVDAENGQLNASIKNNPDHKDEDFKEVLTPFQRRKIKAVQQNLNKQIEARDVIRKERDRIASEDIEFTDKIKDIAIRHNENIVKEETKKKDLQKLAEDNEHKKVTDFTKDVFSDKKTVSKIQEVFRNSDKEEKFNANGFASKIEDIVNNNMSDNGEKKDIRMSKALSAGLLSMKPDEALKFIAKIGDSNHKSLNKTMKGTDGTGLTVVKNHIDNIIKTTFAEDELHGSNNADMQKQIYMEARETISKAMKAMNDVDKVAINRTLDVLKEASEANPKDRKTKLEEVSSMMKVAHEFLYGSEHTKDGSKKGISDYRNALQSDNKQDAMIQQADLEHFIKSRFEKDARGIKNKNTGEKYDSPSDSLSSQISLENEMLQTLSKDWIKKYPSKDGETSIIEEFANLDKVDYDTMFNTKSSTTTIKPKSRNKNNNSKKFDKANEILDEVKKLSESFSKKDNDFYKGEYSKNYKDKDGKKTKIKVQVYTKTTKGKDGKLNTVLYEISRDENNNLHTATTSKMDVFDSNEEMKVMAFYALKKAYADGKADRISLGVNKDGKRMYYGIVPKFPGADSTKFKNQKVSSSLNVPDGKKVAYLDTKIPIAHPLANPTKKTSSKKSNKKQKKDSKIIVDFDNSEKKSGSKKDKEITVEFDEEPSQIDYSHRRKDYDKESLSSTMNDFKSDKTAEDNKFHKKLISEITKKIVDKIKELEKLINEHKDNKDRKTKASKLNKEIDELKNKLSNSKKDFRAEATNTQMNIIEHNSKESGTKSAKDLFNGIKTHFIDNILSFVDRFSDITIDTLKELSEQRSDMLAGMTPEKAIKVLNNKEINELTFDFDNIAIYSDNLLSAFGVKHLSADGKTELIGFSEHFKELMTIEARKILQQTQSYDKQTNEKIAKILGYVDTKAAKLDMNSKVGGKSFEDVANDLRANGTPVNILYKSSAKDVLATLGLKIDTSKAEVDFDENLYGNISSLLKALVSTSGYIKSENVTINDKSYILAKPTIKMSGIPRDIFSQYSTLVSALSMSESASREPNYNIHLTNNTDDTIRGSNNKVGKQQKEFLTKRSNVVYKTNTAGDIINDMTEEERAYSIGIVKGEELSRMPLSKRLSQVGKNIGLQVYIDNFTDRYENLSKGFKMAYQATKVLRNNVMSVIDPQGNTVHRFLVRSERMRRTISFKTKPNGEHNTGVKLFQLALAQSLDIGVDKMTDASAIKDLNKLVTFDIDKKTGKTSVNIHNEELRKAVEDVNGDSKANLSRYAGSREGTHTLLGVVELSNIINKLKEGEINIKTDLVIEEDGITSGMVLNLLSLGSSVEVTDLLMKGGVYTDKAIERLANTLDDSKAKELMSLYKSKKLDHGWLKEVADIDDFYEIVGSATKNELQKLDEKKHPIIKAVGSVISRNQAKTGTTSSVYGASSTGTKRNVFLNVVLPKLEEDIQKQDNNILAFYSSVFKASEDFKKQIGENGKDDMNLMLWAEDEDGLGGKIIKLNRDFINDNIKGEDEFGNISEEFSILNDIEKQYREYGLTVENMRKENADWKQELVNKFPANKFIYSDAEKKSLEVSSDKAYGESFVKSLKKLFGPIEENRTIMKAVNKSIYLNAKLIYKTKIDIKQKEIDEHNNKIVDFLFKKHKKASPKESDDVLMIAAKRDVKKAKQYKVMTMDDVKNIVSSMAKEGIFYGIDGAGKEAPVDFTKFESVQNQNKYKEVQMVGKKESYNMNDKSIADANTATSVSSTLATDGRTIQVTPDGLLDVFDAIVHGLDGDTISSTQQNYNEKTVDETQHYNSLNEHLRTLLNQEKFLQKYKMSSAKEFNLYINEKIAEVDSSKKTYEQKEFSKKNIYKEAHSIKLAMEQLGKVTKQKQDLYSGKMLVNHGYAISPETVDTAYSKHNTDVKQSETGMDLKINERNKLREIFNDISIPEDFDPDDNFDLDESVDEQIEEKPETPVVEENSNGTQHKNNADLDFNMFMDGSKKTSTAFNNSMYVLFGDGDINIGKDKWKSVLKNLKETHNFFKDNKTRTTRPDSIFSFINDTKNRETSKEIFNKAIESVESNNKEDHENSIDEMDAGKYVETKDITKDNLNDFVNELIEEDALVEDHTEPEYETYKEQISSIFKDTIDTVFKIKDKVPVSLFDTDGFTHGQADTYNFKIHLTGSNAKIFQTRREVFSHEMFHLSTQAALNFDKSILNRLSKLKRAVENNLKDNLERPEHLFAKDGSLEQLQQSERTYDYIFNKTKSNEFFDYAMTNPKLFAYIAEHESEFKIDNTFYKELNMPKGKIKGLLTQIWNKIVLRTINKVYDKYKSKKTLPRELLELKDETMALTVKLKNDKMHSGKLNKLWMKSNSIIAKPLAHSLKAIRDQYISNFGELDKQLAKKYVKMNKSKAKVLTKFTLDLLHTIFHNTAKDERYMKFYEMLNEIKKVQEDDKEHSKSAIRKVGYEKLSAYSEKEQSDIHRLFIDTDMSAVTTNTDELHRLMTDEKHLNTRIKFLENKIQPKSKKFGEKKFFEMVRLQGKGLAQFMVHGQTGIKRQMLNAENIKNGLFLNKSEEKSVSKYDIDEKDLDQLISLYAFRTSKKVNSIDVKKGKHGISKVMNFVQETKDEIKRDLFAGEQSAYIQKGYSQSIFDNNIITKVIKREDLKLHQALGYKVVNDKGSLPISKFDSINSDRVLVAKTDYSAGYSKGIMEIAGFHKKGSTIRDFHRENSLEYGTDIVDGIIEDITNEKFDLKSDPFTGSEPIPLININGKGAVISNYRYTMSNKVRESVLGENKNAVERMAETATRSSAKHTGKQNNELMVDWAIEEYKNAKDKDAFVLVGPRDKRYKEQWDGLPDYTKQYMADNRITQIPIRPELLNDFFGYQDFSFADYKSHLKTKKPKIYKGLQIVEAGLKDFAKLYKPVIAIINTSVVIGNIKSNYISLVLQGINPITAAKDLMVGIKATSEIREKRAKLREYEARRKMGENNAEDITRLKVDISENPLFDLEKAGLISSIVEDVNKDKLTSKNMLSGSADKLLNKITGKLNSKTGNVTKEIVHNMYVTSNTSLFEVLLTMNQAGDAGARYALDKHLRSKGISRRESHRLVAQAFVMYNGVKNQFFQTIEQTSFVFFLTYLFKNLRIAGGILMANPTNVVAYKAFAGLHGDDQFSPYENGVIDSIVNRMVNPIDAISTMAHPRIAMVL